MSGKLNLNIDSLEIDIDSRNVIPLQTDFTPILPDASGRGHHATQHEGSLVPRMYWDGPNGLPVIRFNGSTWVKTPDFDLPVPLHWFFVVKANAWSNNSPFITSGSGSPAAIYQIGTDQVGLNAGMGGLNLTIQNPVGRWLKVEVVQNGANSKVRVDGSEIVGDAGSRFIEQGLKFGFQTNCDLTRVLLFSSVLSGGKYSQIQGHLEELYGV